MGTILETTINVFIDDSIHTFKMNNDLELSELKKKIEAKTNIPAEEQELFKYGGQPLLNYLCLKSLQIKSKTTLYLYKKSELFEISVSCSDYEDKFDYTFLIHGDMTIDFIKSMILQKSKMELYRYKRFSLLFNGIILNGSKLVKDYDIKEGSLLIVEISHLKG